MKISTLILLMFVGFLSTAVKAQDILWLDAEKNKTVKEEAVFYRPTPQMVEDGYKIIDYYKSGKKQMEGFSFTNTFNEEEFDGVVKEYYPTGELKSVTKYDNGEKDGVFKAYYKNGKIKTRGRYREDKKVGVWKIFYKNSYK